MDFEKQEIFRTFAEILATADDITLMQAARQALDTFWKDEEHWRNFSEKDRQYESEHLLWEVSAALKRYAWQPDTESRPKTAGECVMDATTEIFRRAEKSEDR